jgi:Ca-activated chloride channel family protein
MKTTRSFIYTLFASMGLIAMLMSACAPAATQVKPAEVVETIEVGAEEPAVEESVEIAPIEPEQSAPLQPPVVLEPEPEDASAVEPGAEGAPVAVQPVPLATAAPSQPGEPAIQPVAPPADNYFRNYGANPYEDPREDHLSTFALDVDTASYSVARRYVMDGMLPPADAVRLEEFVNYFEPGYANPQDVAFAIYADGAPSPFEAGVHILRFGVQGYEVAENERKPANLTFVIDVSGSMDMENRLGLVKQSLELLVDRLRPSDTVAIVVYGSDARVLINPTSAESKGYILDAIYSLRSEGSTNAEAGLILGYQLAFQAFRPGATNRVILCSDGVANVGATGPEAILEQIRGYAQTGITLTTVGFGMGNFNDVLMEQLADNGDGHYAYVDTLDEARKLFVEDLTSTLQVIARDAKVQVDFNPDVVSRYRLLGYENRDIADQDFRNDTVDAGELGAGHSAVALYAVLLNPGVQGRIATVQLRWQDPESFKVTEINGNYNTWDLAQHFESADPRYQLAVIVAYYAERLRLSPWTMQIPMSWIVEHAVRLAGQLPTDEEVSQFAALLSRAAQISALNQ